MRKRAGLDNTAERNDGNFGCTAADVDDHVGGWLMDGEIDANRSSHGLFDENHLLSAGVQG